MNIIKLETFVICNDDESHGLPFCWSDGRRTMPQPESTKLTQLFNSCDLTNSSCSSQPQALRHLHLQVIISDGGTRRGCCCKRRGSGSGATVDYKAHNVTLHLCPASFASFFLLVVHLTSVFAVQRIKLLFED